jgi:hypothetical protein
VPLLVGGYAFEHSAILFRLLKASQASVDVVFGDFVSLVLQQPRSHLRRKHVILLFTKVHSSRHGRGCVDRYANTGRLG